MAWRSRKLLPLGLLTCLLAGQGCVNNRPEHGEGPPSPKVGAASADSTKIRMQQGEVPPPLPVKKASYSSNAGALAPELTPFQVRPCAWVNGKPLLEGELYNLAGNELAEAMNYAEPERSVRRQKVLKAKLKKLIDQEVVLQDAYRKLEKNPQVLDKMKDYARKQFEKNLYKIQKQTGLTDFEFKKKLKEQGASIEAMRRQMERELIVTEYMRSRVMPSLEKIGHQEIREYYQTHLNEFQTVDEVDWEDIFILVGTKRAPTLASARQLAQALAQHLAAGEPIAKLIEYDDGDASTRKGKGYGRKKGEIKPPELEPYLFQMKAGQVGQPVELSTGIHVFRVVNRQFAGQLPFNQDVQDKIRVKLKNDIAQHEFDRIVRELSSKTVIEVDPDVLK